MSCKPKTGKNKGKKPEATVPQGRKRHAPLPSTTPYGRLDNTKKAVDRGLGLFSVPEAHRGAKDCGIRKCVIFYFDSEDQYEQVRAYFDKGTSKKYPYMDTDRLLDLLSKKGE